MVVCIFGCLVPDLVPAPGFAHKVNRLVLERGVRTSLRTRLHAQGTHKDAQGTHKGAHKVHPNLVQEVVAHKVHALVLERGLRTRWHRVLTSTVRELQ